MYHVRCTMYEYIPVALYSTMSALAHRVWTSIAVSRGKPYDEL